MQVETAPTTRSELRAHWLLRDVPSLQLERTLETMDEHRFLPGEVLYHWGDDPDAVYFVTAGMVRITSSGGAELAVARANEILGELSVLNGESRTTTATANTFCVAYRLPRKEFLNLLDTSNAALRRLTQMLALRVRSANNRIAECVEAAHTRDRSDRD